RAKRDWSSDVCSSDLGRRLPGLAGEAGRARQPAAPKGAERLRPAHAWFRSKSAEGGAFAGGAGPVDPERSEVGRPEPEGSAGARSEEHTSELQSRFDL